MHDILQLDRSGWSYQARAGAHVLRHDTGQGIVVHRGDGHWNIYQNTGTLLFEDVPGAETSLATKDEQAAFWAEIDAAVGPASQAHLLRVYRFVQTACILAGFQGVLMASRKNAIFGFGWSCAHKDGDHDDATRAFGPFKNAVEAAMTSLGGICSPGSYQGDIAQGPASRSGKIRWDVHFTQHARLALMQETGPTGPSWTD